MIELVKPDTDPWFNIAAEEYVTHHMEDEVFMLWENTDCVVIGKHQHALSEVNLMWLENADIPVIRRISGGGTVFQGVGNINYSFVTNHHTNKDRVSFERATAPIRAFLKAKDLDVELTGKSNLTIKGKKISGNAAHLYKNRSLHHGTLLFDAHLETIRQALDSRPENYLTKAIQSNRAEIINLNSLLREQISREEFLSELRLFIRDHLQISDSRSFTKAELNDIEQLAEQKYRSWDWNIGYSPDYQLTRTIGFNRETVEISLHVSKGMIKEICASKDTDPSLTHLLQEHLIGCYHRRNDLIQRLKHQDFSPYIAQDHCQKIAQLLL